MSNLESIEPELADMVTQLEEAIRFLTDAEFRVSDAVDSAMHLGEKRPDSEFYADLVYEVQEDLKDQIERHRDTLKTVRRRMHVMQCGLRG